MLKPAPLFHGNDSVRSSPRRPGVLIAVILAAAAFAAIFAFKAARKMPDLEVYWKAGVRARAAEPLYRAEDQHYVLKYLPAFAVLAIPVGMLPLETAKAAWFAISVLLLVALLAISLDLMPERRRPPWLLVVITFVAMAKFYGHELVLGQVNLLLGVIGAGAILLLRSGSEVLAGVLVALAIVVKPYAIIFLPWLLARRRPGSILAFAIALCAVLLLPAAIYGLAGNMTLLADWWRTVTGSTPPNLLGHDNVSLAAMYAKWMGPGTRASVCATVSSLALLLVAGFVFLRRNRTRFPEALEGALLLTLIPLLSPQGWDYVFLLSTPAIMLLVNDMDLLPPWLRVLAGMAIAVVGLSIYDVIGRANYAAFMSWSIVSVCYLVVIGALVGLRVRGAA